MISAFRVFTALALYLLTTNLLITSCSSSKKSEKSDEFLVEVEGAEALSWVKEQNTRSAKRLEAHPQFQPFHKEALAILTASDRLPTGAIHAGYVYNFWQDSKIVRGHYRRTTLEEYKKPQPKWEILLNVDLLAQREKENWVLKSISCLQPEYKRCLIGLSRGGKDATVIREYDLVKKSFVPDGFTVPEAKTRISWQDENHVLVATDFGAGTLTQSGYPFIIKRWRRGQTIGEAETLLTGDPSDALGMYSAPFYRQDSSRQIVLRYSQFRESKKFLLDKDNLVELPLPESSEFKGIFQDHVIVQLRYDWALDKKVSSLQFIAGDLISISVTDWLQLDQKERSKQPPKPRLLFRPNSSQAFSDMSILRDQVLVHFLENVSSQLNSYTFKNDRWQPRSIPLPGQGTIRLTEADSASHQMLLTYESFLEPNQIHLFDGKTYNTLKLKQLPSRFNADQMVVESHLAVSKDGTRVPFTIIRPLRAQRNGKNPTLLYGYGGFEISLTPSYIGVTGKSWVDRGGIYVLANIRGGGEFGPTWHQAALTHNRQRAFDDFIAVAEELIRLKVTSPEHLGIQGGSNGGLLVGAVATQRPELFSAVLCQVPLLDMLNFHRWLAGASWMAEYGNPEDSKDRAVLASYSPLHALKAQKEYPEIFFITSTKDDRVHPAHARKMAYRMQNLDKPFLYFEKIDGGHAAAANYNEMAYRKALELTYLAEKLGL